MLFNTFSSSPVLSYGTLQTTDHKKNYQKHTLLKHFLPGPQDPPAPPPPLTITYHFYHNVFTLVSQSQLAARAHNVCTHFLKLGRFGADRRSDVYIRFRAELTLSLRTYIYVFGSESVKRLLYLFQS